MGGHGKGGGGAAEPTGFGDHLPDRVASPLSDNGFNRLFSPDPAFDGTLPLFTHGLSDLEGLTASAEVLVPLIHWLISTPTNPLSCSTAAAAATTTTIITMSASPSAPSSLHPPPTFRMSLLRRLLACSPALARPLRDATGQALRLMSRDTHSSSTGGGLRHGGDEVGGTIDVAHFESLRTMLRAIDAVEPSRSVLDVDERIGDEDPSGQIRRLRMTLDEMFPGSTHASDQETGLASAKMIGRDEG